MSFNPERAPRHELTNEEIDKHLKDDRFLRPAGEGTLGTAMPTEDEFISEIEAEPRRLPPKDEVTEWLDQNASGKH